jgi:hypothetical protein
MHECEAEPIIGRLYSNVWTAPAFNTTRKHIEHPTIYLFIFLFFYLSPCPPSLYTCSLLLSLSWWNHSVLEGYSISLSSLWSTRPYQSGWEDLPNLQAVRLDSYVRQYVTL